MHFIKHNKSGQKPDIIEIPDKQLEVQVIGIMMKVGLYQHGDDSMEIEADRRWLRTSRLASEAATTTVKKAITEWIIKGILGIVALGIAAWIGGKEW